VYSIDGRTRAVRPGQFLLVEAGSDLEARTPPSDKTVGLCVYLGASLAPEADRGALGRVIEGSAAEPLAALLGRYAALLARKPQAGEALAARIVDEVTVAAEDFVSSFCNRLDRLGSLKRSTRIETLQRVERARAFIHANTDRALSLDSIAAAAALSRFHLSRSFASVHGLPPLAYHRRLRLDVAAQLLKAEAASASELAGRLGYGSLSAFTRAFRQAYGVPPSGARGI
jgi:AraC-like DNA-binding protein